jgi:hypothetical protein
MQQHASKSKALQFFSGIAHKRISGTLSLQI